MANTQQNPSPEPITDGPRRPDRPDHPDPWAMQIVVRRDRQRPAQHVDVCETVARAVVRLLDDERSRDGEWSGSVRYWREGWIRKVVRRAENKRWEDAQTLPGVTVCGPTGGDGTPRGTAEARAVVPGPLHPLPRELAKLQVGGTEFPRDDESSTEDAVVRLEISPLIEISTGKTAAQAGHAAQLAYEEMDAATRDAWRADGFRVRLERPTRDAWLSSTGRGVSVIDAGLTEVDGPTETARAIWQR